MVELEQISIGQQQSDGCPGQWRVQDLAEGGGGGVAVGIKAGWGGAGGR